MVANFFPQQDNKLTSESYASVARQGVEICRDWCVLSLLLSGLMHKCNQKFEKIRRRISQVQRLFTKNNEVFIQVLVNKYDDPTYPLRSTNQLCQFSVMTNFEFAYCCSSVPGLLTSGVERKTLNHKTFSVDFTLTRGDF